MKYVVVEEKNKGLKRQAMKKCFVGRWPLGYCAHGPLCKKVKVKPLAAQVTFCGQQVAVNPELALKQVYAIFRSESTQLTLAKM